MKLVAGSIPVPDEENERRKPRLRLKPLRHALVLGVRQATAHGGQMRSPSSELSGFRKVARPEEVGMPRAPSNLPKFQKVTQTPMESLFPTRP